MRLNPPGGDICILKEELFNPNASTISGGCREVSGGAGASLGPLLPRPSLAPGPPAS